MPAPTPAHAGDQHDAAPEIEIHRVSLPSKVLCLECHDDLVRHCRTRHRRRDGRLSLVNAIPRAPVRPRRRAITAGRDLDTHVVILRAEWAAASTPAWTSGDAAHHRLHRVDRCQPGMLRRVQGGLRACGKPGGRRRQRLLRRRRNRLVGNADVIVLTTRRSSRLPRSDAAGLTATHLSRLVPPALRCVGCTSPPLWMRRPFAPLRFGPRWSRGPNSTRPPSGWRVTSPEDTRVIRAAKEALNFIDSQQVNSRLPGWSRDHLRTQPSGVSDELHDDFAGRKPTGESRRAGAKETGGNGMRISARPLDEGGRPYRGGMTIIGARR